MDGVATVRDECRRHGVDEDEAGYVLWNHTGFPSFYEGEPAAHFRRQVRRWLANRRTGPCGCDEMPRETDEEHLDVDEGLHPRCPRRVEVE